MLRQYPIQIYTTYKNQIPKISFVQHDTEVNRIYFEFYDDINVPMTDINSATLTVKRFDGNTYTYGMNDNGRPVFIIEGNLVTVIFPPGAVFSAGECQASISLYDTDMGRLTTQTFKYNVTAELIADTPIDETDNYPILTELLGEVEILKDTYQGAIDGSIIAQDHIEIVNARKTFDTLEHKIDNMDSATGNNAAAITTNANNITANAAKIAALKTVNVSAYGAVGDGITDDTIAFQSAVDSGNNIIADSDKTYLLTFPISNIKDNQIIDLRNCNIIYSHDQARPHTTDAALRTNNVGIFNIKSATILKSLTVVESKLSIGQIIVSDVTGVNKGDIVKLQADRGAYSDTTLNAKVQTMVEITDIDVPTKTISIDYVLGDIWSMDGLVNTFSYFFMDIVKPVIGSKIKNFTYNDITPFRGGFVSNGSTPYPIDESHYAVCGISMSVYKDVEIDNVTGTNGMFSTVWHEYGLKSKISNITNKYTRLWAGGEGYTVQNGTSSTIELKNIRGVFTRHTIDFSGGHHYKVDGIYSYKAKVSDVQFHGIYEHDIEIKNLDGTGSTTDYPYLNMGSGTDFGNASANVTFANSKVFIGASMDIHYSKNFKFINCMVYHFRQLYQETYDNCKVYMHQTSGNKKPLKRGTTIPTKSIFNNCELIWKSNVVEYINCADILKITDCSLINAITGNGSEITLYIQSCKDIVIEGNDCDIMLKLDANMDFYNTGTTKYVFSNNNIGCQRYGGIYIEDLGGVIKANEQIIITNNNFYNSPKNFAPASWYSFDLGGAIPRANNIEIVVTGNNATGSTNNTSLLTGKANIKYMVKSNLGITDLA